MAVLCGMTTIQYLARSARLSVWLSKWACPKMTSGQSNWHKAHRRRKRMVQCYSTGDGNVSSHEGTLAPPGEYDWIVHPSAHSSPQPKWLIDRFSHFCTAHSSVVGHAGHVLYPNNCPIAWGIWAPSNTCFLGPTRHHNPPASRSAQLFFGRPFLKWFALRYRTVVLSVRLSVCPVCDFGALGPNGWMDQDETLHAGRLRPRPHCVRWLPPRKRAQSPHT